MDACAFGKPIAMAKTDIGLTHNYCANTPVLNIHELKTVQKDKTINRIEKKKMIGFRCFQRIYNYNMIIDNARE